MIPSDVYDIEDVSTGLVKITEGEVYDRKHFAGLFAEHIKAEQRVRNYMKKVFPFIVSQAFMKHATQDMMFPDKSRFSCVYRSGDETVDSYYNNNPMLNYRAWVNNENGFVAGVRYESESSQWVLVRCVNTETISPKFSKTPTGIHTRKIEPEIKPVKIEDILNTESMAAIIAAIEKYLL